MRKVLAALGLLVLLPTAYAWLLVAQMSGPIEESRFAPPGSAKLELDQGTYRIYFERMLANERCEPEDHFGELEDVGLALVAAKEKPIAPTISGGCHGGNNQDGTHPVSFAEFEVADDGHYTFRGRTQPAGLADGEPTTVYLVDVTDRTLLLTLATTGTIIGATLLFYAVRTRPRT